MHLRIHATYKHICHRCIWCMLHTEWLVFYYIHYYYCNYCQCQPSACRVHCRTASDALDTFNLWIMQFQRTKANWGALCQIVEVIRKQVLGHRSDRQAIEKAELPEFYWFISDQVSWKSVYNFLSNLSAIIQSKLDNRRGAKLAVTGHWVCDACPCHTPIQTGQLAVTYINRCFTRSVTHARAMSDLQLSSQSYSVTRLAGSKLYCLVKQACVSTTTCRVITWKCNRLRVQLPAVALSCNDRACWTGTRPNQSALQISDT